MAVAWGLLLRRYQGDARSGWILRHVGGPLELVAHEQERPTQALQPGLEPVKLDVIAVVRLPDGMHARWSGPRQKLPSVKSWACWYGIRIEVGIVPGLGARVRRQPLPELDHHIRRLRLTHDVHDLEAQRPPGAAVCLEFPQEFHED